MAHLVPPEPKRYLCPVRPTDLCVQRTSVPGFMQSRRCRLLHCGRSFQDTRASRISQWIVNTVVTACEHADPDTASQLQVRALAIRAIASSMAYFNIVKSLTGGSARGILVALEDLPWPLSSRSAAGDRWPLQTHSGCGGAANYPPAGLTLGSRS